MQTLAIKLRTVTARGTSISDRIVRIAADGRLYGADGRLVAESMDAALAVRPATVTEVEDFDACLSDLGMVA